MAKIVVIGILLVISNPVFAGDYLIEKGNQYQLCKDLLPFIKGLTADGRLGDRSKFDIDGAKFKSPSWKLENDFLGLKIKMQTSAYSPTDIDGWKKRIYKKDDALKNKFQVQSAHIDINNDGTTESVVSYSSYIERFKVWSYGSVVVDKFNNVDHNFEGKESPSTISGEIFFYKGRTYSMSVSNWNITIDEFFSDPMRYSGGFMVRGEVCIFDGE